MPAFPDPDDLTEEQSETLEQAAYLVIRSRKEAEGMLMRSGVEPVPEPGFFGNPCGAKLAPPPANHRCGCRNYEGDGGACRADFTDFTGPDFGTGAPVRNCGHRPSQHFST
ncbi:DUF6422 family protein [Streptomyces sp. NPDC054932]